jgi:hypothetical protein
MTYGGKSATRESGLAHLASTIFEALGVLNPGSSDASAVPDPADAANAGGITSNALNVTRVGSIVALITGAGGAALALFSVDKANDPAAVVVAAYGSVGLIVSVALLVVAIVIAADIRARGGTTSAAASPPPKRATVRTLKPTGNKVSINGTDDVSLIDARDENVRVELPEAGSFPDQLLVIRKIDPTDHEVLIENSNGLDPLTREKRELRIYSAENSWHEYSHT